MQRRQAFAVAFVDIGVDHVDEKLTVRIDEVTARLDVHEQSTKKEFEAVQFAFGEMRQFVSESFGTLRKEMVSRFDQVDHRFDRMEEKLDRALAPR